MTRARILRLSMFLLIAIAMVVISLIVRLQPTRAANCSGTDHLETISVFSLANPVSNATVRFYLDPQLSRAADNLRTSGTGDAIVTTGSNGITTLALSEGTYYVTITASGQQMLTTTIIVPADGTCGSNSFYMTPSVVSGEFSTDKTTVTLSPTTIRANGTDVATLTVQAFNQYGSIVPFLPAGLNTSLEGMQITHLSTSTDATGRVSFKMNGIVNGTALLTPTLNGITFRTVTLTLTMPTASTTSLTPVVSAAKSHVVVNGTPALPNGTSAMIVDVTAVDDQNHPLVGRTVALRSAIDSMTIAPPIGTTDANGVAHFSLTSSQSGSGYLTVSVDGYALSDRPIIAFAMGTPASPTPTTQTTSTSSLNAVPGMLIKLPDDQNPATQQDSTVYYLGSDLKRHPFPNQKIFATWYTDFSSVHVIDTASMANLALGAPVTYRPGMLLIKSPSSPKVYAIAGPNTLRWITSAEIVTTLYGSTWATRVQDLPDGFWTAYTIGSDVTASAPFDPSHEQANALSIDSVIAQ